MLKNGKHLALYANLFYNYKTKEVIFLNLSKKCWNNFDYQEYLLYLQSLKDVKYQEFHKKLTFTKYEIIGIRVPIQRKIAKEIFKGDFNSFLKLVGHKYYEEINIMGFVIAQIKDFELLKYYLEIFIPLIDNWAICDSFCSSLKIVNRYPNEFMSIIVKLLESEDEYAVRVGLVLLLDYYVKEPYIPLIINLLKELDRDEYYINMACSWLLAECYIKSKEITLPYLEKQIFKKFIQNKTISKICDSYRVSINEKNYLKTLRK